jgi:hypothetical protein
VQSHDENLSIHVIRLVIAAHQRGNSSLPRLINSSSAKSDRCGEIAVAML